MTFAHHALPDPQLRPFATDPGRWEREVHACRFRVRITEFHAGLAHPASRAFWEELTRIDERTDWGWVRWQAPPTEPKASAVPQQITVLSPRRSRTARLASRWLTRRPPLRIYFDARCRFWVTGTTVLAAFAALIGMCAAMSNRCPADVGVPLMLLLPVLTDYLPGRLDARARAFVRTVQDTAALQLMQRFVALHQSIQVADDHATPDLARAVELGHRLLWDLAGPLAHRLDGPSRERLRTSERLLALLARQACATRVAKDERDHLAAHVPRTDGDTGGALDQSIKTTPEAPEVELVPDALIKEAADALHQAEMAYHTAAARIRQLDRTADER